MCDKPPEVCKTPLPMLVLCVDDDPAVARSVADIVEMIGPRAVTETSSLDAIAKWARDWHLKCVLADFMLPKMDGAELLAVFRDIRPDVRRVLITAAPEDPAVRRALKDGTAQMVVAKPFNLADLKLAVSWL